MNHIEQMKTAINKLYGKIKNDEFNQEEFQQLIFLLEQSFGVLGKEEGYNPDYKDEMMLQLENYSKTKLVELERKALTNNQLSRIQEQTVDISKVIHSFWKETGFNYIEHLKADYSGSIEVSFGFSLDYGSLFDDKKNKRRNKKRCDN